MNSNIGKARDSLRKDVTRLEEEVVKLFIIIIISVECSTSILNHQCPTGDVLAPEMMVASLVNTDTLLLGDVHTLRMLARHLMSASWSLLMVLVARTPVR